MNLITVYPRLFTTRSPGNSGVVVSKGDASVVALYGFLTNLSVSSKSWKFRRSVLETSLRLFGDFEQWLTDQYDNPQLTGFNREFLADTLDFINGADRRMNPRTWVDLMQENTNQFRAPSPSKFQPPRLGASGASTVQIIQKWCSREGGIEDLLISLHILFGAPKV